MAQLKITCDDFSIKSTYYCRTRVRKEWSDDGMSADVINLGTTTSDPVRGTHYQGFAYELPAGATVTSAKVYATLGTPAYGAEYCAIDWVSVNYGADVAVDVELTEGATSKTVTFVFDVNPVAHDHSMDSANGTVDESGDGYTVEVYTGEHYATIPYTDVYLLIEYEPPYTAPELVTYTDPALVQGETWVKAVHMTELHENVNRIRVARGLAAYAFSTITALATLLASWNAHVLEIREAVDDMDIAHETWLTLGDNYPRYDVLVQLRRVVEAML